MQGGCGSAGCLALILAFLCILSPVASAQEDNPEDALYRYRNDKGVLVIDFSIPPEYAQKGYDILSPNGRLISRIPPSSGPLTTEQILAREEQRKLDAFILRSYSSLEDVARAKKRRLQVLEREIDSLKYNLVEFSRRETELKDKAAAYQASGQSAPDAVTEVLEEIAAQQVSTRQQLAERRLQYKEMVARYDYHAVRLKELRPQVVKPGSQPGVNEKSPPR